MSDDDWPAEPGETPEDGGPALNRTFYVSATGDDSNSGESESLAWRTLRRVNDEDLEPGDTVLLEGGARFSGTLELSAADGGTREAVVRVGSFGSGRAIIEAGDGDGIVISDASYVAIEKLVIAGDWDAESQSGNDGEGVEVIGTVSGRRRSQLQLRELEVYGFKHRGIGLHAQPSDDAKDSGYEGVLIADCEVHDNGDFGVASDGPYLYDKPGYSHADVTVRGVRSHHNRGLRNKGEHTGSGIVLSDVATGLIEHSIAHDNGEFNDHKGGGGFGIWAWDSDRITIQYNESYDNKTRTADGGGFDLDGGVTRSVMQFNYSHGNQGAGFGAFQFSYARPYSDNLVQYNISQNDGAAFLVWDGYGDMGSVAFVQNIGYGTKPALATYSALREATFANNLFYGTGLVLFDVYDGKGITLQGNAYWSGDAPFAIAWNSGTNQPAEYASYEAFRAATGAETLDGEATGLAADPQLVAAGTGPTLDDTSRLSSLTMYELRESSPLLDRGADLDRLDIDAARSDFFGRDAPQGRARDIGVHEFR